MILSDIFCGAPGVSRERRLQGNDVCANNRVDAGIDWESNYRALAKVEAAHRSKIAELELLCSNWESKTIELQDFAIWLTGCGYDFCQHDHFIKQRDKLLKGD